MMIQGIGSENVGQVYDGAQTSAVAKNQEVAAAPKKAPEPAVRVDISAAAQKVKMNEGSANEEAQETPAERAQEAPQGSAGEEAKKSITAKAQESAAGPKI